MNTSATLSNKCAETSDVSTMAHIYTQSQLRRETPQWVTCDPSYSMGFNETTNTKKQEAGHLLEGGLTRSLATLEEPLMNKFLDTSRKMQQPVYIFFKNNQGIGFVLSEQAAKALDLKQRVFVVTDDAFLPVSKAYKDALACKK